ncbi:MAG: LamB/YcsF family protein [Verrucomicrobia bacterium]|nr:LamB/YcsF family protein [Verrucomicrobiota bacterium]
MPRLDLNCDLGEGAGCDAELMPLVTSASIACGAHAGDEATMRATVRAAQRHGVVIGAHPGFADRAHFGRRELELPREAIMDLVRTQVATLRRLAAETGAAVRYVKPHGALYNLSARNVEVADAIAAAVAEIDTGLVLYGLAGGELLRSGRAQGLAVASEVFADRTYRDDGSLTPRDQPGALITDEDGALAQVLRMVREGRVRSTGGIDVPVTADTVCLHGDGPKAVAFARALRAELLRAGVAMRPLV